MHGYTYRINSDSPTSTHIHAAGTEPPPDNPQTTLNTYSRFRDFSHGCTVRTAIARVITALR